MSRRVLVVLCALAVLGAAGAAAAGAPHSPAGLRSATAAAGPVAPLAFLAAWVALTVALFPGTVLAAAGGLLFGPLLGTALSLAGATLGGLASFALARGSAGPDALDRAPARVRAVAAPLERRGLLAVAAARALPGMPATLLHYAAGLTRVRTRDFAGGIALGAAPRVVAYTALGGSLGDPASATGLVALGLLGATSVVALVAVRRRPRAA